VVEALKSGDMGSFRRMVRTFNTLNPRSDVTANPVIPNYLQTLRESDQTIMDTILDHDISEQEIRKFEFLKPKPLPDDLYV